MHSIIKSTFYIAFIIISFVVSTNMLLRSKGNKKVKIFGFMVLLLGVGESFHLVPRILEIFLENGSIILNGLRTNSGNYGDERLVVKPNLSATAAYKGDAEYLYEQNMSWEYEMVDFVDSCLEGRPYSYADYQDAKKVTKLIDSVYRSAVWI